MKKIIFILILLNTSIFSKGNIENINIESFDFNKSKNQINGPNNSLSLEDLLSIKISSGSFLDLNIENSPYSITIISAEQIKLSGAKNISELLEIYVPGFQYMYNKWNGTIWGLRGVSNDRNTKIIYLINGHKLNTQGRDGFVSETTLGLLEDIDRVEILRGASGLVYGSGAIAGVINVITKNAQNYNTEASISYGSNNSKEIELNIFSKYSDHNKLTFSFGINKSDGLKTRLYGYHSWPFPNKLETRGVPSDGNFSSTPGNMKGAVNFSNKNLKIYARATRQIENAGGWFILDPYPDILGVPSVGTTEYIQKNIPKGTFTTYKKDSLNYWLIKTNSDNINDTIGTTNDNIYYTPLKKIVVGRAPNRIVDGETITPNDPFWSKTESWGENRRQYINDNILFDIEYNLPMGKNELLFKSGIDLVTNRISTEQNDRYDDGDSYPIRETFGETRYNFKAQYLLNTIKKLDLAIGSEFRVDVFGNDIEDLNEKGSNPLIPIIYDTTYTNITIFSEGNYKLNKKFDLQLGFRFDKHTHANMLNGKFASIYKFNRKNNIKFIFQTASNNGSVDNYEYNRFHYDANGVIHTSPSFERPYALPNINTDIVQAVPTIEVLHSLKPEKVKTIEITSYHKIGKFLNMYPSITYGMVDNLFGWSQDLYRVVNAGSYNYINFDFDSKINFHNIHFGFMHTFQKPFATDVEAQEENFIIDKVEKDSTDNWYTSVETNNGTFYKPVATDKDTISVNIVKSSITSDGINFLNLATNTTKLFLDYKPVDWFTFHTDLRIFWSLSGRTGIYKPETENDNFQYWNIWKHSIKKLNSSIHFNVNDEWTVSLFAYNILGIDNAIDSWKQGDAIADISGSVINTIRWQQMSNTDQKGLVSSDQRSFKLNITKTFN